MCSAINAHSGQKKPDNFDEILQSKVTLRKIFVGEMSFRTFPITLLHIFCKIVSISKVIVRSIEEPDDKFSRYS